MRTLRVITEWICRAIVGCAFVFSGLAKCKYPYDFLEAVYQYQLFGRYGALLVAGILPYLEITVGMCLLFGFFKRSAAYLSLFLGVCFVSVQVSALLRGLNGNCGCFGSNDKIETIGPATIARAMLLVILSACIWLSIRVKSREEYNLPGLQDEKPPVSI